MHHGSTTPSASALEERLDPLATPFVVTRAKDLPESQDPPDPAHQQVGVSALNPTADQAPAAQQIKQAKKR